MGATWFWWLKKACIVMFFTQRVEEVYQDSLHRTQQWLSAIQNGTSHPEEREIGRPKRGVSDQSNFHGFQCHS